MKERYSEYRFMWIMVFFDLPTETKKQRKAAANFRKDLVTDGFTMFQFSIYIRNCPSAENAQVHVNRIHRNLPEYGKVGIITITDKQFSSMEIFFGKVNVEVPVNDMQLELF